MMSYFCNCIKVILFAGLILYPLNGCKEEGVEPDNTIFNPSIPYGSMTDQDGNAYKTVTIGNQTWMAENMKVTHYLNGDTIPEISNLLEYRRLYNWNVIMDNRKFCPEGWHIPTYDDFRTLITFLKENGYGNGFAGENIAKSLAAPSGWVYSSTGPGNDQKTNNSSGFSAIPWNSGFSCDLWSITNAFDTEFADGLKIVHSKDVVTISSYEKKTAIAVRCIKD